MPVFAEAIDDHAVLAERLQAAFDQSPSSTVVYDASGRPIAVNPAFEKLWGAALADVPADYSVLHDPQLEKAGILPLIRRAFAGEVMNTPPIRYEMESAAGRGRVLWTQAHLYPVRDADGRVVQVVLAHQDVTAQREAEAALATQLSRAQTLLSLTTALANASTQNEAATAAVDHARQVLGAVSIMIARVSEDRSMIEVVEVGPLPGAIAEAWRSFPLATDVPLADVARSGQPLFIESREQWEKLYPHLRASLEATGHHASASIPLIVDSQVIGVLAAAFDQPRAFTEEDRALAFTVAQQSAQALERSRLFEAERSARQQAEAANRAKSDFLAIMSHELRTPLNAIGGYTELIEMGVRGPVSPEQRRDLRRIQTSQRHLLGLINEVLNYAKLESGSVVYDFADVPAVEAMAMARELVAPQAEAKRLKLTFGSCSSDILVRADTEKLQQILVNLLSNAVKFTDAGEIELGCDVDDVAVRFVVRDTGIGIPAVQLNRIFEPFVQVRADLTRTIEGTGLGLAISRDLARGMGGDLTAESETGRGSAFTLSLPRSWSGNSSAP